MLRAVRAGAILAGFLALTLPLMPVQLLLVRLGSRHARTFPHRYHRWVCRLIGLRLNVHGTVAADRPVLIVSNHVSWLDIPVLSAVAPISFVAKSEVGTWPLVGALARLQRTVFVDRKRRVAVGDVTSEMASRLGQGDHIVLFAEGTSSDGNRVLPFKTSLFAAAAAAKEADGALRRERSAGVAMQTLAIAYTSVRGLPMGRWWRPNVAWYGDMEMASHAWELLKSGPIDVHISVGQPVDIATFADRKAMARFSEEQVRRDFTAIVRHGRPSPEGHPPPAAAAAPHGAPIPEKVLDGPRAGL